MLIARQIRTVTTARDSVMRSPALIPFRIPIEAIIAPPISGAAAIGTRLISDWKVKPIARLLFGSASPMIAKIAGEAMLVQAIANAKPKNTNGHEGLKK